MCGKGALVGSARGYITSEPDNCVQNPDWKTFFLCNRNGVTRCSLKPECVCWSSIAQHLIMSMEFEAILFVNSLDYSWKLRYFWRLHIETFSGTVWYNFSSEEARLEILLEACNWCYLSHTLEKSFLSMCRIAAHHRLATRVRSHSEPFITS